MNDITLKQKIMDYYSIIDTSTNVKEGVFTHNQDVVDRIIEMFAENGQYAREGTPLLIGKDALKTFFGKDRPLVGKHIIDEPIIGDGIDLDFSKVNTELPSELNDGSNLRTVIVKGDFIGEKHADGKVIDANLEFDDFWVCNDAGEIVYRQSDIRDLNQRIDPKTSNATSHQATVSY